MNDEANHNAALTVAKIIKMMGETLAKQITLQAGNLAIAALVLQSAQAEIELNIYVQCDETGIEDYKKMKEALADSLEKATTKALAGTDAITTTGGAA